MKEKIFLLCCVLFAALTVNAAADNEYHGFYGENITWALDSNGVLTFSGNGQMYDRDYSGYWAEVAALDRIISVVIEDGITNIGSYGLAGCGNLTSISIPDSVVSIRDAAFFGCRSLSEIYISSHVTFLGNSVFEACTNLKNIEVSNDNPYYCDIDGVLFDNAQEMLLCYPAGKSEKEYDIPDGVFSVSNDAFAYSRNLESVRIPESVVGIGNVAFSNCRSLTNIHIPASVVNIGRMAFAYCENLTSVSIPVSVTAIPYGTFYVTHGLKDVYYSGNAEQWNAIEFGDYNDSLFAATIHYNSAGPESAPVAAPGTVQTVSTSDNAYAAALDYSAANLNAGTAYRILYGLYDANGQLQSIRAREITFDDTFRAELMIDGAENGLDCKIFLSGVDKFAPQCETAKILFRE